MASRIKKANPKIEGSKFLEDVAALGMSVKDFVSGGTGV